MFDRKLGMAFAKKNCGSQDLNPHKTIQKFSPSVADHFLLQSLFVFQFLYNLLLSTQLHFLRELEMDLDFDFFVVFYLFDQVPKLLPIIGLYPEHTVNFNYKMLLFFRKFRLIL